MTIALWHCMLTLRKCSIEFKIFNGLTCNMQIENKLQISVTFSEVQEVKFLGNPCKPVSVRTFGKRKGTNMTVRATIEAEISFTVAMIFELTHPMLSSLQTFLSFLRKVRSNRGLAHCKTRFPDKTSMRRILLKRGNHSRTRGTAGWIVVKCFFTSYWFLVALQTPQQKLHYWRLISSLSRWK